jgi:hypothetical protein
MGDIARQIARVDDYFRGEAGRDHYGNLVRFAESMITRYAWYSARGNSLPGGLSGQDIVDELLGQVLESNPEANDRRRIPEDVEVEKALRMHIRSKLSALSRSWENRNISRGVELTYRNFNESDPLLEADTPLWPSDDDEADEDERVAARQRTERFIAFVENDQLLYAMLILIRDEGLDRPVEAIARRLDVSVKDIYIARRRLRTAVSRFIQQEKTTR